MKKGWLRRKLDIPHLVTRTEIIKWGQFITLLVIKLTGNRLVYVKMPTLTFTFQISIQPTIHKYYFSFKSSLA